MNGYSCTIFYCAPFLFRIGLRSYQGRLVANQPMQPTAKAAAD